MTVATLESRLAGNRTAVVGTRLLVLALGVLGWEVGARSGFLDALAWSSPSAILDQLGPVLTSPELAADLRSTVVNVLLGFGLGLAAGASIGALLGALPLGPSSLLSGYLVSFDAVPLLIFYPILLTTLGLNRLPIVIVVACVVIAPVALNTAAGLREIPSVLRRLALSLEMRRAVAFRKVYLPAAVPLVFPGLRLGFLAAVVSTIGMEFIVASRGLGYRIGHSYHSFAIDEMYVNIVIVCTLAITANASLSMLERRLRRDVAA